MFCSGYASLTVLWLSFLAFKLMRFFPGSYDTNGASHRFSRRSAAALLDKPDSDDLWRSWHLAPALWYASSSQFAPVHFLQTTESISGLPPTAVVLSFWCFGSVIIGGFSTYGMAGIFSISKNFRFYVETFPNVHSQVQLWLQCMTRLLSEPWNGRHELFNLLTRTHHLSCHLNYRI